MAIEIHMIFKKIKGYFCRKENIPSKESDERSFSNFTPGMQGGVSKGRLLVFYIDMISLSLSYG